MISSWKNVSVIQSFLVKLPVPMNISVWWNFGSLLGSCLLLQIITGLFLSIHYNSSIEGAFLSVDVIMREVSCGSGFRMLHANGASLFFFLMYFHMGRGLYYGSYGNLVWVSGLGLLVLSMGAAFLGYVLPWGQMSFWGATVITNLFSVVPGIGKDIVNWLWGGFSVGGPTLSRFYSLHFLLPFTVLALVGVHLLFLHEKTSTNPLGVVGGEKVSFHSFYSVKDFMGVMLVFSGFSFIVGFYPWMLGDCENFLVANSLVTPVHIQPEWYFLFAYAILRSIPSKMGGVIALGMSIVVLSLFFLWGQCSMVGGFVWKGGMIKMLFWSLITCFLLLTWIGACPVESVYISLGKLFSFYYFLYFFSVQVLCLSWEKVLK